MSPRVAGAALALLAAVMLVVSAAGLPTGWWSGPPSKSGITLHKKNVDVSLLGAVGCNTGGDGHCEPVPLASGFATLRYAALGASGLLVLLALVLAIMTLGSSDGRKKLAVAVMVMAGVSAAIAFAMLAMPKLESATITVPIGPGLYVFFGGIVLAVLGSLLARRPTPKLELQPSRQPYAPALTAPPSAQPVDVLALLRDDPPPAAPGFPFAQLTPAAPPDSRPPPSPGGQLAGPAGPLAPPGFGVQPQAPYPTTRPAPPAAQPPPLIPPTPFPSAPAPFSARPGAPPLAPPPPAESRGRSATGAPPLPDRSKSSSSMPAIPERSRTGSMVPAHPERSRTGSMAPAIPERSTATAPATAIPASAIPGKGSGSVPAMPDARSKPPSVPPPDAAAAARTKAASVGAIARPKSPSVAPLAAGAVPVPSTVAGLVPPRAKGVTGLPPPRGKGPSVPPPASEQKKATTLAAVVPPPAGAPLFSTKLPVRADTDPADHLETVNRDAIGDSTDANFALPDGAPPDDHTDLAARPVAANASLPEPRDSASDIQTAMQRKLTQSELVRTVARESQTEIETIAREKLHASELAIGDSTSPAILTAAAAVPRGASQSEIDELGEAATVPATSAAPSGGPTTGTDRIPSMAAVAAAAPAKLPVSTAPESLPPPKQEEAATSGPTPACPQCEAPMAWVEEHLRFYCKSCRMYF